MFPDDVLAVIVSIILEKKIVILSTSNIIASMFMLTNVWLPLTSCNLQKNWQQFERLLKSHDFKVSRLCIYIKTTDTSNVVEFLGRAGLKLETPSKTLIIIATPQMVYHSQFWLKWIKQIWQCLQMSSLLQHENILLNIRHLLWWLPERDLHSADDNIVWISVHVKHIKFLFLVDGHHDASNMS